jgi:RNA polymerase sigma factor (sigma-70 family)
MLTEKQAAASSAGATHRHPSAVLNHRMRGRRRALGLTQQELSILARVSVSDIQAMERFAEVTGKVRQVHHKLHQIANVLELDFDELFPPSYLQTLEEWKLSPFRRPFAWAREVPVGSLSPREYRFAFTDEPMQQVDAALDRSLLRNLLDEFLKEFTPRERRVVEERFGWRGEDAKTFEEVGMLFNVSRERIRQLESRVLRRLRHPTRSKLLRSFR